MNGDRKSEGRRTRKEGVLTREGERSTKLRHSGKPAKEQTDRHRTTQEAPACCRKFPGNQMRLGGASREATIPLCRPATQRGKPSLPAHVISGVASRIQNPVCYKMEQVVHQLCNGQRKLEWALEKHMKQEEVDRTMFARSMVRLQKYVPGKDPMAFFLNFERAARASAWPTERWPFYLAQLITGEAQVAYQIINRYGFNRLCGGETVYYERVGGWKTGSCEEGTTV
ncbi:hypothetical protein NDU88_001238 [Pleurodeles waltl]|uniref:Uncharacterized protein n=1 Tax=Pleurodeles waltl TaxID=8319 RepID=A0AAV7P6J4_PLEWA|nr:hypothetical protein NDU88_001238 [Pleurodeles waltl]